MDPEVEPAADALRRYFELWQRNPISGKEAAAMARELRAYATATDAVRATLSHGDQPANFAMYLTINASGNR
jgi:hypothetical protein